MIFRPLAGAGAGKSLPRGMDDAVHPLRAARSSGVATQLQRKIPEVYSGIFLCCASPKAPSSRQALRWTKYRARTLFQRCPVLEASRFPDGKCCHTRGRRRAHGQFFMTRTARCRKCLFPQALHAVFPELAPQGRPADAQHVGSQSAVVARQFKSAQNVLLFHLCQ